MTRKDKFVKRDVTDRYWAWCDEARIAATGAPQKKITDDVFGIVIFAHFQLPESWSEKKKMLHYGRLDRGCADADNVLKACMDALFAQDKTIAIAQAHKFWCEEGAEPRVDVFLLSMPREAPCIAKEEEGD